MAEEELIKRIERLENATKRIQNRFSAIAMLLLICGVLSFFGGLLAFGLSFLGVVCMISGIFSGALGYYFGGVSLGCGIR